MADGLPAGVAYRTATKSTATAESCTQQASRWRAEPAVAARLRWLLRDRISRQRDLAAARGRARDPGERMSRADKLAVLEAIIGNPASDPQHVARAVEVHSRLAGETDEGADQAPDPAFLAAWLRRAGEQGIAEVVAQASVTDAGERKVL